jgi:hypothetical protein
VSDGRIGWPDDFESDATRSLMFEATRENFFDPVLTRQSTRLDRHGRA